MEVTEHFASVSEVQCTTDSSGESQQSGGELICVGGTSGWHHLYLTHCHYTERWHRSPEHVDDTPHVSGFCAGTPPVYSIIFVLWQVLLHLIV